MKNYAKILCSLPVILLTLYFIPFLGIVLIIIRYFVYKSKTYGIDMYLIICGLIILIPKLIDYILKLLKIDISKIPYLETILNSEQYPKILGFSKLLITLGIIFLIISYIFKNVVTKYTNKVTNTIQTFIEKDMQQDYEIKKANDLLMQEKREKAKNTHVVKCPYCGSDNMLTSQTGTCKYCRKNLEYKE